MPDDKLSPAQAAVQRAREAAGVIGPIQGASPAINAVSRRGIAPAPAPTADPLEEPAVDSEDVPYDSSEIDMAKLLEDGKLDMDEILAIVLQAQLEARPNPDEYADDPTSYAADVTDWSQGITELLTLQQKATENKAGLIRIDENTVIPERMLASLSPDERAQVDYIRAINNAKLENEYATIVNKYRVDDYDRALDQVKLQDERAQREWNNQRQQAMDALSFDRFDLDQAVANVNRGLQGLAEGRARAAQIDEGRAAAAAYGTTNGKTNFSAADFGGLTSLMAQRAGINPGASLFNFPGTYEVDPEGTLARQDARLGVSGAIPGLPQGGSAARSLLPGSVPPAGGALPSLPSLLQLAPLPGRTAAGAAPPTAAPGAGPPADPLAPARSPSLLDQWPEDFDTPRGVDPYADIITTRSNNSLFDAIRSWGGR